jgi:hypothetical protein
MAAVCPTASCYPGKHAGVRRCLVKVEGLGIKLLGKALDPLFSHVMRTGGKFLADIKIVQVKPGDVLDWLCH